MAENSLTLTLGYDNTDFTRKYRFTNLTDEQCAGAKAKILQYNANLPAADKNIFVSDDYDASDPQNVVGTLKGIVAAQYETVEYTRIPLN